MKLFQKQKAKHRSPDGSTATTVSVLTVLSAGENSDADAATLPSPTNNSPNNNNTEETTTSISMLIASPPQTAKRHKQHKHKGASPLLAKLKTLHHKRSNKMDGIAEARQRAAKRMEPPPFSPGNMTRLNELKEAKLKAEERAEERNCGGGRSGSGGIGIGGSSSSVASTSTNSIKSTRTMLGVELEEERMVHRHAMLFLASLLLQLMLMPFRHGSTIALLLVALHSISLWSLLNSVLVYAFDSIDFGQKELVKNMEHGKRLFVGEVEKHSVLVAGGVAAASCASAAGGRIAYGAAHLLCSTWESVRVCDYGARAVESWAIGAFRTSGFITSRLGVFVLALLLMSHLLLPKHAEDEIRNDGTDGEKTREPSNGNPRQKGHTKLIGALPSFGIAFLLALHDNPATAASPPSSQTHSQKKAIVQSVLVAGSLNADTFLPIKRFPSPGENLTLLPGCHPSVDVPGGKGCNQAIACAKLQSSSGSSNNRRRSGEPSSRKEVFFLGQFGNDPAAEILRVALVENDVDVSCCGRSNEFPSGRGYVMIVPDSGEVSAVVSGGSNSYGWRHWGVVAKEEDNNEPDADDDDDDEILSEEDILDLVSPHSLVLMQCEVPNLVNVRLARAASKMNIPVIVDVGGEDRKMERDLLECCDYLVPNETELERLAKSYQDDNASKSDPLQSIVKSVQTLQRNSDPLVTLGLAKSYQDDQAPNNYVEQGSGYSQISQQDMKGIQARIGPSLHLPSIVKSAQTLQKNGASNVLVTLGAHGSILIKKPSPAFVSSPPSVIYQPSCSLPCGSSVVDETGAGDCYRAGFAVALLEHCGSSAGGDVDNETLQQCMKFASAAGALAVTKKGAVPSIPSRREVEELLAAAEQVKDATEDTESANLEAIPRGGSRNDDDDITFPFLFGSRLNSMKDRLDLVDPSSLPIATPRDWVRRQAEIRGLGCVDFNYPQHFGDHWTPEEAKKALEEENLVAGAVCLRYSSKFARGAMNHPDPEIRREAIDITKEAAEVARILGCNEVVVWSAFDGYDYPFQVSYQEKWDQIVEAFKECCDAYPDIKWSLEFKPTDENTRFFTVPSTGAAMLLVKEIDRPNMGLTLDMGHMLMAGENPGQSIAMVGEKLFGIQLNDGYTRLAAEDGMMFGSIHPSIALEAIYQLSQINFGGHLYFDTFPQRTDPVKEAEYNIRRVKEFWKAVMQMDNDEIQRVAREHDAIGALELVNEALKR